MAAPLHCPSPQTLFIPDVSLLCFEQVHPLLLKCFLPALSQQAAAAVA